MGHPFKVVIPYFQIFTIRDHSTLTFRPSRSFFFRRFQLHVTSTPVENASQNEEQWYIRMKNWRLVLCIDPKRAELSFKKWSYKLVSGFIHLDWEISSETLSIDSHRRDHSPKLFLSLEK